MKLNTIEEIIDDLKAHKMVIIMDDEDRENEGDLVMAAEAVTPEHINFMAKYGRGLICMPITQDRADHLKLWPQTLQNHARFATNFTVSIEAAEGVTTGISAKDRATTVKAAVNPSAKPEDLVQPGHIFPIVAREGGVLTRAGHTEAGCDLARLAGFSPAAVIVEVLNDDGSMARRPDLEIFANKHQLKIGTVADLIRYRMQREKKIERLASAAITINQEKLTLVAYSHENTIHYALCKGTIQPDQATFVRVHMQNPLTDLFHQTLPESTHFLEDALKYLQKESSGVIVTLANPVTKESVINQIQHLNGDTASQSVHNEQTELKNHGIGAQILNDLGVKKMRLLSSPKKFASLSGFGLEVVEYVND